MDSQSPARPVGRPTTRAWTTPADARATLHKRWRNGDLLASLAAGVPVVPQAVPLRGPGAREIAGQFAQVQEWVRRWESETAFRVEYAPIGGRLVGVNHIPARAWIDEERTLWRVLGVAGEVDAWRRVVALTESVYPAMSPWIRRRPADAVAAEPIWERALAVVQWIVERGGPTIFLRQVDVPGVDTKFIENHRTVLTALLDEVLPPERIDPTRPRTDVAGRYGLAGKPTSLRLRRLDGGPLVPDWTAPSGGPAELTMRTDDLAGLQIPSTALLVVENETTYLALPSLYGVVAIFGGGYAAARLRAVSWLAERPLLYWGDIDTHGFAILDGLRAFAPHARSVLMDRATLEAHEGHWVREATPSVGHLARLTGQERALYDDLVEGRYGETIRLEQERVRYGYATRELERAVQAVSKPADQT